VRGYIAQLKARPPFFVLFGNAVDSIPESYKRYLVNGLRETFGLIGVPIRLWTRSGVENPYSPKPGS
jgi:GTP-binding protein